MLVPSCGVISKMKFCVLLTACLWASGHGKKTSTLPTTSTTDEDQSTDQPGMMAGGYAVAGDVDGAGATCDGPMYITTQGIAAVVGDGMNVTGTLVFDQSGGTGPVTISGAISGLSRGNHGLHIAQYGNTRDGCSTTGGDYNPDNYPHGGPTDAERHAGDLGNIKANVKGTAVVHISSSAFSLNGDYSFIGRAVVVYEMEDDLGRGNDTDSTMNGSVGRPVGCGVIGISAEEPNPARPAAPEA